ncbi:hypothetical protein MCEMAEM4_03099 [Burkholderiaceae bacterium]
MAETANVTTTPGANYTWNTAKFAWNSAASGKNWSSAYPANYVLNVASDLNFAELVQKLNTKQIADRFAIVETSNRGVVLNKFEAWGFVETYTDLIAYVLRFVESFSVSEQFKQAWTKSVFEAFQVGEGLARQLVLKKLEAIGIAETYTDLIAYILRVSESFSFSEVTAKNITKPKFETISLSDGLAKSQTKRVAEAFAFAEIFGRTVAYRRAIAEGFAIGEALKRAQTVIVP